MKFSFTLALAFASLSAQAQLPTTPEIRVRVAAEAEPDQMRVDTVYMRTDPNITKDASFPGGDQAWQEFIDQNLVFPIEAEKMTEDKKVVFSFVVSDKGDIRQMRISRSADWEFDKNAMHMMQKMPLWDPAEINGKPVGIYCILPVVFKAKGVKAPATPTTRKKAVSRKK